MSTELAVVSPDGRRQIVTEKVFRNMLEPEGWQLQSEIPSADEQAEAPKGKKQRREIVHESGKTMPKSDDELFDDDEEEPEPTLTEEVEDGFEALRSDETPKVPPRKAKKE